MHLGARLWMRGLPSLRSVCLGAQPLTRLATCGGLPLRSAGALSKNKTYNRKFFARLTFATLGLPLGAKAKGDDK